MLPYSPSSGITTDWSMFESVVSFKLLLSSGEEVCCSLDGTERERELFSAALGGYGLFGVIHEVTLKVNPNTLLDCDPLLGRSCKVLTLFSVDNRLPTYLRQASRG